MGLSDFLKEKPLYFLKYIPFLGYWQFFFKKTFETGVFKTTLDGGFSDEKLLNKKVNENFSSEFTFTSILSFVL